MFHCFCFEWMVSYQDKSHPMVWLPEPRVEIIATYEYRLSQHHKQFQKMTLLSSI
jgi:hypothetical protein